jgi:pyruvate kinase
MASDGVINNCRGLTIQGEDFQPTSLTAKDLKDLDHILSFPVYDAVALSFVGSDADVLEARQLASKANREIPIVAKIETAAGVANINTICGVCDFVMVARGDLAVAIPWLELPSAVSEIASAAKTHSTPWILATQIAEGLERFAMPTRAEICDLAHWMKDGCAGILLSYETAFGAKPIAAVACTAALMSRWKP